MTTPVSTDTPTQAILLGTAAAVRPLLARVIEASDGEIDAPTREAENAASEPGEELDVSRLAADGAGRSRDAEVAGKAPVQDLYEAAMARLDAMHDSWGVAMAEFREGQADSGRADAAA